MEQCIQDIRIFQGIEKSLLLRLYSTAEKIDLPPSTVFKLDKNITVFYLVLRGQAEILPGTNLKCESHLIGHLRIGDIIGEEALMNSASHSVSIRSLEALQLLKISKDTLDKLANENPAYLHIYKNLFEHMGERVRHTNKQMTKLLNDRSQATHFVITGIAFFCFTLLASSYTSKLFSVFKSTTTVMMIYLGIIFIIFSYFLLKTRIHPKEYGITLENVKQSIFESLSFTVVIMIILTFCKLVVIQTVPTYQHLPLFDFFNNEGIIGMQQSAKVQVFIYTIIAYFIGGILQELIARGILQGQLEKILHPFYGTGTTIVLSNIFFASFHITWSIQLTFISFFAGMLWGWMYARHKTIIGVGISHALLGIWALKMLNIPAMYHINPFR